MTKKSRYFLIGLASLLLVGLGGGMLAYVTYHRAPGVTAGLPAELRYVPVDVQMVAYADVHAVMASDLRRELERMATGRRGQQQMHEFAGVDLEKDVNRVVVYIPEESNPPAAAAGQPFSRVLLLAQGKFEQAGIEQFIKDHGGVIEDYRGRHIGIRRPDQPAQGGGGTPDVQTPGRVRQETAIGFVTPDLIAIGPTDLVHQAMDVPAAANITTNADVMALIRDDATANVWVVGRFDAVSRRMGLPPAVRSQVPPLRLVSASAHVDGSVKATIKALTADEAAASQLRDVVRGAISFVRLQAGSKPELQEPLKSVELGGTGNTAQLSFTITSDTLRALNPQRAPAPPPAPQPKQ